MRPGRGHGQGMSTPPTPAAAPTRAVRPARPSRLRTAGQKLIWARAYQKPPLIPIGASPRYREPVTVASVKV